MSQPQPGSTWPKLTLVHLTRSPRVVGADFSALLIQLHGFDSNERDLFRVGDFLDPRFLALSVRAPLARGPDRFAWFDHRPLPSGGFDIDIEALRANCDRLAHFIAEATGAYHTDPRRVYLLGFSQGATVALATALSHPQLLAGVVALSGYIPPEARSWGDPASELVNLPIFQAHGTLDSAIPIDRAHATRDLLQRLPVALSYHEYVMPHLIGPETLRDMQAWLTSRLDEPLQQAPGVDERSVK